MTELESALSKLGEGADTQHVVALKWQEAAALIAEVERLGSALSLEKSAHDLTGQHATDLDGALAAERAAHATTKAERDKAAAKLGVAMKRVAAGKPSDRSEKAEAMLAAAEARAVVLAAKVARCEALAERMARGLPREAGFARELRAALGGDE